MQIWLTGGQNGLRMPLPNSVGGEGKKNSEEMVGCPSKNDEGGRNVKVIREK